MASQPSGLANYLALFGSFGTLICCALPSALVVLGLGATLASLISAAPWIVEISRHKVLVFSITGTLIGFNFLYTYAIAPRLRGPEACAIDGPGGCDSVSRLSRGALWISAALYAVGFFAAFLLAPLLQALDT